MSPIYPGFYKVGSVERPRLAFPNGRKRVSIQVIVYYQLGGGVIAEEGTRNFDEHQSPLVPYFAPDPLARLRSRSRNVSCNLSFSLLMLNLMKILFRCRNERCLFLGDYCVSRQAVAAM